MSTPSPSPIALSDRQLDIIETFAQPLHQMDRGPFLQTVARLLGGQEIGDGLITRVCRQAQREFLRAPDFVHEPRMRSKYR